MKRPTIDDVAKSVGVSKGIVSFVINGKNNVNPATREQVLKAIKEMNYRPKGMARNLKTKAQGGSIGLISSELSNLLYSSIASGVREYAGNQGYSVFITSSENHYNYEKKLITHFAGIDIKGLIIVPVLNHPGNKYLLVREKIKCPFVVLDTIKDTYTNMVTVDKIKGVQEAIKYLIKIGHTKIIYFAGSLNTSHTQERIDIFRSALIRNNLSFHKEMIQYIGCEYDESFSNTISYFKDKEPSAYPTAILCFNDYQALAVIAALKKLKMIVPHEVSVIGYDDVDSTNIYPDPLTTIKTPLRKIGEAAAKLLIKNIESPIKLEAEQIVFETEFIIKKTSMALYK